MPAELDLDSIIDEELGGLGLDSIMEQELTRPADVTRSDLLDAAALQSLGFDAPEVTGVFRQQTAQEAVEGDAFSPGVVGTTTPQQQTRADRVVAQGELAGLMRTLVNFKKGGKFSVGALNLLREYFGNEAVKPYVAPDGQIEQIYIRNPATKQMVAIDDPNVPTVQDFTSDLADVAMETGLGGLLAVGGSMLGLGPVAAGVAGDVTANIVKQAGGAILPGDEDAGVFDPGRLAEVGLTGVSSLAAPYGAAGIRKGLQAAGKAVGRASAGVIGEGIEREFRAAGGAIEEVPGQQRVASEVVDPDVDAPLSERELRATDGARGVLAQSPDTAIAREAETVGVRLTPGQATGDMGQLSREEALRELPGSKELMTTLDRNNLTAIRKTLNETIENVGNRNPASAGVAVGRAFSRGIRKIKARRRKHFDDALARAKSASGGKAIYPISKLRAELLSLSRAPKGMEDVPAPMRARLRKELEALPLRTDVDGLQELLAKYRKPGFWEDALQDATPADAFRSRLLNAIQEDLEEAATNGVPGAKILAEGRVKYAAFSKQLDRFKDELVANSLILTNRGGRKSKGVVRFQPSKVASMLLTEGEPTNVRRFVSVLNKSGKRGLAALQDIRAASLHKLFSATESPADNLLAESRGIARAVRTHGTVLNELFRGDLQTISQIHKIDRIAKALALDSGMSRRGARTAALQEWISQVAGIKAVAAKVPIVKIFSELGEERTRRISVELMLDPAKRRAVAKAAQNARKLSRQRALSYMVQFMGNLSNPARYADTENEEEIGKAASEDFERLNP